jgi:heat shock protein HslJ
MKRQLIYGLLCLTILSCEKIDTDADITINDWKVVKFRKQGHLSYVTTDKQYILRFLSDTTFGIGLDVNACGGQYNLVSNGNINFENLFCTEICCDSDFAEDLASLFPKMKNYFRKGDELILEGRGRIVFKVY